jgi:ATP-dependent protease Clp ATPase subunit
MSTKKISLNELRTLVKQIINENEKEETLLAKKYVDDMIDRYVVYKNIRKNILSNVVNSEYGRTSNSFVTKVWDEFNKRFPS